MSSWSIAAIPPQRGSLAIVTGVGGLGYETAAVLAGIGMRVVLAGRDREKGDAALHQLRALAPAADLCFELLDLADLASIAAFAQRMTSERDSIELLVNNAGIMMPPTRRTTADGFELQFGTNYLGHFALTAQLLAALSRGRARVVNVSSSADRFGRIDFDNLQAERRYNDFAGYNQSKLANSIFTLELQRRSDAAGWGLTSVAAQPGFTRTNLIANGMGKPNFIMNVLSKFASHSAAKGALSIVYAATMPDVRGGDYYGPDGPLALIGEPHAIHYPKRALDEATAQRLWKISEELTHVRFDLDRSASASAAPRA